MTSRARQDPPTTDPAERARALALAILDRAPRSAADLRSRLVAKEVPPELADALIERYREVGLIDDAALAATIARTRQAERSLAPRAIRMELERKGFGADDIDAALAGLDLDEVHESARILARRRWEALSGVAPEARQRRVAALLMRKGHSPALAFGIVRDLMQEAHSH